MVAWSVIAKGATVAAVIGLALQNHNGITWRIVLERNGTRVFGGARTTRPPSGSLEARRVVSDTPAADRFRARATSPSGEVCTARASF